MDGFEIDGVPTVLGDRTIELFFQRGRSLRRVALRLREPALEVDDAGFVARDRIA